mgnify:CR=1 FL=1
MTELEKLKRWAEKQGWFLLQDKGIGIVSFLIPAGQLVVVFYVVSSGRILGARPKRDNGE